jgi:hypothetical protein
MVKYQPVLIKRLVIYYVVHVVLVPVIYSLSLLIIYLFVLIIRYCRSFILLIIWLFICFVVWFYSSLTLLFYHLLFILLKRKSAILILNCVQVFRSRSTSSIRVNKRHTADSTDFVLVKEHRTYYHHSHCGIDGTNILQVDIALEGETFMNPVNFRWTIPLTSYVHLLQWLRLVIDFPKPSRCGV